MRGAWLVALLAVAAFSGCLGVFTTGLDVVVENQTDAGVKGTLTLLRANQTVATFALDLASGEILAFKDVTRTDGRYVLNLTLDDGRTREATIHAGGPYGAPQVKIGARELLIFQNSNDPPRTI